MFKKGICVATAAALMLAACGGGGSDPAAINPASATPTAEGVWQGTLSNGAHFSTLILEDGTLYTLYGPLTGGVFYINGLLQGAVATGGGTLTSTDARDYKPNVAWTSATVNATYTAGDTIKGAVTEQGVTTGFSGDSGTKDTSAYNYSTAADLSAIAGTWALTTLQGTPVAATITNGNIQATSNGCHLTGTVAPRASGKNVFDVSVTFGPAPCALPGQTTTGIALFSTPGGRQQLIVAAINSDRSAATLAFGIR